MIDRKAIYVLIILILIAFTAGCAGQAGSLAGPSGEAESAEGGDLAQGSETGSGVTLLSDGKGGGSRMEITPGATPAAPNRQDMGAVNSQGTEVPPIEGEVSGEGMVMIGGSESSGDSGTISNEWVNWPLYEDEKYLFSVHYPEHYVVLDSGEPGKFNVITALHTVRFQEERIVEDGLEDLEPPKFTVDVFAGIGTQSLKDWISANRFSTGSSTVEAITVEGAKEAYRVTLNTLMAPNVFYYLATDDYVYRVVPLGPEAETMLASFKLTGE